MAKVINFPMKNKMTHTPLVVSNASSAAEKGVRLNQIPIIGHALFLLAGAAVDDGIKLTQTGALNRKFVQAFWEKFLAGENRSFRPTRELECSEVTRIHALLADREFVYQSKGATRITLRGRRILDEGATLEFYRDLLLAGMYAWNWAYEDRFPEYEVIQDSAIGLVESLWHWPSETLTAVELFESIFVSVNESGERIEMKYDEDAPFSFDTYDGMVRCLNLRFFERFCVPFGILRDLSEPRLLTRPTEPYQKTEFFITDFPSVFGQAPTIR